jgi:hypothetical protein
MSTQQSHKSVFYYHFTDEEIETDRLGNMP